MKKNAVIVIFLVTLLSGCSSTAQRTATVGAGSAAGAGIGYAASNGNPYATGGGAVAGGLLTSMMLGKDEQVYQDGYRDGYKLGQMDAIKREYWAHQAMHAWGVQDEAEMQDITIQGQTVTSDGRVLVPHDIQVPTKR